MGFSSQFALKSTQPDESEKQLDPKVKLKAAACVANRLPLN